MRITPYVATLLAAACSSSATDDPPPRSDVATPPSLAARLDRLRDAPIETSRSGAWVVRRTPAAAADGADGAAAPGRLLADSARVSFAAEGLASAPASAPTDSISESARSESEAGGAPRPSPGLRAGSTDDNRDLAAFLAFLDEKAERGDLKSRWQPLDVRDMRAIRVVDGDDQPRAGVPLRVIDEDGDRIAFVGTTQGDGRVPFFPHIAKGEAGRLEGPYLIEVEVDGRLLRQHWDVRGAECVVKAPRPADAKAGDDVALDVVFVIDTTGSMGDEIERIKQTLLAVTDKLRSLEREFTLRYGAVLYRDVGDEYVTSAHPFTTDLAAFDAALQDIAAGGGGDGPESLNQGLAVAVDQMDWRPGAAHVAFLIADAPPHMDYAGDVPYGTSLLAAIARGIRIHAVAASGLDEVGSIVFRQIAQATRGEFVFVEYGGDVTESGEAHGVAGVKKSNNLDDIVFEKIRDEIARWGRDA